MCWAAYRSLAAPLQSLLEVEKGVQSMEDLLHCSCAKERTPRHSQWLQTCSTYVTCRECLWEAGSAAPEDRTGRDRADCSSWGDSDPSVLQQAPEDLLSVYSSQCRKEGQLCGWLDLDSLESVPERRMEDKMKAVLDNPSHPPWRAVADGQLI